MVARMELQESSHQGAQRKRKASLSQAQAAQAAQKSGLLQGAVWGRPLISNGPGCLGQTTAVSPSRNIGPYSEPIERAVHQAPQTSDSFWLLLAVLGGRVPNTFGVSHPNNSLAGQQTGQQTGRAAGRCPADSANGVDGRRHARDPRSLHRGCIMCLLGPRRSRSTICPLPCCGATTGAGAD